MKRWIKQVLFVLFAVIGHRVMAGDSVIIRKDPRLDVLSAKQLQANQRSSMMTSSGQYRGFRIQVISTTKRDEAFKIKSDLLTRLPDQKTYVIFQSPSFKVRVGNFLKREDAEKFKIQMNKLFPQGVYIVEDVIDYTPTEEGDIVTQ